MITMNCMSCNEEYPLQKLFGFSSDTAVVIMCESCTETKCNEQHNTILTQLSRDDIKGYSPFQIATIMVCLECDHEYAKVMCDYMDSHDGHPDWSEASWLEFAQHINALYQEMSDAGIGVPNGRTYGSLTKDDITETNVVSHELMYCDNCGEQDAVVNFYHFGSVPYDVASAWAGESASVCKSCHLDLFNPNACSECGEKYAVGGCPSCGGQPYGALPKL